jgi:hypothetical protein
VSHEVGFELAGLSHGSYFGQFGNTTNPVYDFRGDGILKADPLYARAVLNLAYS